MYRFATKGVCPQYLDFELDGNIVTHVSFFGGCNGNLKAISKIAVGKTVEELAEVWEGNTCGMKSTSCADQLIKALRQGMAADAGEIYVPNEEDIEKNASIPLK